LRRLEMIGTEIILFSVILLILLGIWEALRLTRNLARIPIRVHVNGTRGKSSVTRLIAGGMREAGITTCAKTTGTLARMILPDGSEYPVFRPSGPRIIEQARIVAAAVSYDAKALVVECMALQPWLQWLSESRLLKATHGVITNAREDHLDVMGPSETDVAWALAGMTPLQGKLFTSEQRNLPIFQDAARDRGTELIALTQEEIDAVSDEEIDRFSYVEHKVNVALALKVCADLGIPRQTALQGMWKTAPDPGAMFVSHIRFFGRHLYFVNGFAANDPESTEHIWNMAIARFPGVEKRIAIFNCRSDRSDRSTQLGTACVRWQPADFYLLIGTGTFFFARAAIASGLSPKKIIFAENQSDGDIFETLVELAGGTSCLIMGMANIKGQGLSLARFFRNRGILKEKV
jgi:gamma-polyglutamate synthase